MSPTTLHAALMILVPTAPLVVFLAISFAQLVSARALPEAVVGRSVLAATALGLVASVWLSVEVVRAPGHALVFDQGPWFAIGSYSFAGRLTVDGLSVVMLTLSSLLSLIGARFSITYIHRDPGFNRFFALIALFQAGLALVLEAGTVDLLFVGWELVGLTSTFLIAYFHGREAPLEAGLRAFVTYRICDIGLLAGAVFLHYYAHSSDAAGAWASGHAPMGAAALEPHAATFVALLFLLAAIGKSGAFPLGGWLPRAMEGPTPSSALFYGGLSVAAGAYLLLRVAPLFAESPVARWILAGVGVATFVHATIVGRVQTDAKSQLAYASATQTGLVFVWIALDLRWLAIVHLFGHISLRTYQLLRAPTLLHDMHRRHGALGGEHLHTGAHLERVIPERARARLYRLALSRFGVDALIDAWLVNPILALAGRAERLEQRFADHFVDRRSHADLAAQPELHDEDLA
ncbi:NADH-quinone oxidoreductase subunit 12 [Enhygromyxa salina]|uniref:NADH-quinone oxidoreductase subunit 12 n=1 Tax=Enhygromyxa salina TaxID=215803 RepID=A0A2S9XEA9_9BACT|nr:proton-conducting transporter membrane subunit [Enhygromyxa salina]PRP91187.1 NADH-quinone oxidoreductase subunit 12 [Enhygromyxa salina]